MQFTQFSKIATRQEIDTVNAVIKGVSVIVKGEAQGHGLKIDDTTLNQINSLASQFTDGLKVRFNHPTKNGASILSVAGVLKNFRKDGDCVRADLHLLKSESETPKILEMASIMPESFGLSVVFSGKDEEKDGQKFARCTEIYACDLVDDPAANPTGLFSTNNHKESMFDKFKTQLSKLLGVDSEKATESEIEAALTKELSMKKCSKCGGNHAPDAMCMSNKKEDDDKAMDALREELKSLQAKVNSIEQDKGEQTALAKKSEIDALIADASKEGKVIPLETADIYEQKDGKTTIKMEPSMLRKMLEKLPKSQVALQRKTTVAQSADGTKRFEKGSPEHSAFYAEIRKGNIQKLNSELASIN